METIDLHSNSLLVILGNIQFDTSLIIMTIACFFLLCLIFLYSAVEIAFFTFPKLKLRYLVKQGHPKAILIQKILKEPDELLSSLIIGNAIAYTLIGAFGGAIGNAIYGGTGFAISSFIMICLLIFLGEIVPKVLATQYPVKIAFTFARIVMIHNKILSPIITISTTGSDLLLGLFGVKVTARKFKLSRDEIKHIIDEATQEGDLKPSEGGLLKNVFTFYDRNVNEVMIPKKDVVGINITEPQEDILQKANARRFTRMPVFEKEFDNIKGIIHTKDLLDVLVNQIPLDITKIIRPPMFVQDNMKISEVLREFQRRRIHIALVKDSSNKIIGIITLEDIIEEIVGEIEDEHDVFKQEKNKNKGEAK